MKKLEDENRSVVQNGSLGIHCYGYLLCHPDSSVYPWINRPSGFHTIPGLCSLSSPGALSDPYFLWLAEAQEEMLKETHFN